MSFDPSTISLSNLAGNYPSQTSISLLNGVLTVTSDGDPYPAQAGSNMINDGITPRIFSSNPNTISDQETTFGFTYSCLLYTSDAADE